VIDFRYHLVSIASVFLALAVGIVLGAGPLRGTIGDTLANEVTRLREEANTLRSDLSVAQAQVDARDEMISELRPLSVAGVLDGSTMGVVVLPGSSEGAVDTVTAALTEAGAQVRGPLSVTDAWTSPEPPDDTARTEAAAVLRELLAGELPVGLAPDRVIDLALAWALSPGSEGAATEGDSADGNSDSTAEDEPPSEGGTAPGETDVVDDAPTQEATGQQVIDILAEFGLVEVATESPLSGTEAVVVVPPEGGETDPAVVTGWIDIVGALDDAAGVVVAGELAEDVAVDTDLIAAIRDSGDLAGRISTIDNIVAASGSTALPFVITEQLSDEAGHYGEADSASGLLPSIETPAP
jgi:hypothetical protein